MAIENGDVAIIEGRHFYTVQVHGGEWLNEFRNHGGGDYDEALLWAWGTVGGADSLANFWLVADGTATKIDAAKEVAALGKGKQ